MPATATTSTTVTDSYDSAQQTIAIGVIVSLLPAGEPDIKIEVPPAAVPFGTWALIWDLVVTTPGLHVTFNDLGIILPPAPSPLPPLPALPALPPQVTVLSPPSSSGVGRWTAVLHNDGTDVAAFKYSHLIHPTEESYPRYRL